MKNKSFTKRVMAVVLSLIMVLGLMPMAAFADGTYTFPSNSQSGDNNSFLRYYLTDENAGSITVNQSNKHPALYLNIDDGWYFEKWETYFNGYEDRPILSDPEVKGSNPVSDDGKYTFYNIDQKQPFSNKPFLYIATGTGFYGDHSVTAVLKPILTVNADDGVSYEVTTNSPTTVSANQTAVKYGDNATITYSIDNKYVVTGVSANYGTNYSDNGAKVTVNSIIKPATVTISTKLKQQNVIFNANGGSGTMSAQVFEHSTAQTLTPNSFTMDGYVFGGWNTKADGSGSSYSDKQSVTFTPTNDGDSITLYAQWEKEPNVPSNYTVSFDANGGEDIAPITVTYGEKYGRLPSSAITGLSGGDSNWYLVDENGVVTDAKISKLSVVSQTGDHTLFVKRKVLAPTVSIALTVPGGISDGYQYYIPGASQRVLTASVGNMNTEVLEYSYQWYKDGQAINGATSNVLTLDGNVSDTATYKVTVTATLKESAGIIVTDNSAFAEKEQKVKILHAANTLYYDANGGEGSPSSNYTGGTSITVQANKPTRNGYVFSGWNTKADGTGESYAGGEAYTFAEDNGNGGCNVTLYAQWIKLYGVYVGGVQIIETNKDDVFGDGKVSYDVETGILTLNSYTYAGDGYQYESYENSESGETELYSAAIYSQASITVELKGNNSIQNTFTDTTNNQYGDGVVIQGDVTFIGDGNMSISAVYGVDADKAVTIGNATLEFQTTGYGIIAADVSIKNNANVIIQAVLDGIVALEGNVVVENGADVIVDASRDGIYANKDVSITDSNVTIDAGGDGIYSYDGNIVIDSTKTNISAIGPWLEGTKVTIKADGNYGIFAYNELTVDKKLTVSSPESGSIGKLSKKNYTYGTVVVDGTAAKEIIIEPLGYTVTIIGLNYTMAALVPSAQSLNDAYCEMYGVEDFSKILNTEKEGNIFGGWYTDEACTDGNEFDFNDTVNADITIYAKWVSIAVDDDTENEDNKPTDSTQNETDTENDDNTPSDVTSPDTDDNSNMTLWIVLFLISGGALITLTINERKRKHNI